MAPRKREDSTDDSDDTSEATAEDPPAQTTGLTALSISSREIIRKYFSETKPIFLPQGHPTIALTPDQIGHILRIVADESVKASFEMMDCIIRRAGELNLNSDRTLRAPNKASAIGLDPEASDVETEVGSTRTAATRYSEVSDVCPADDENNSIGYTYEYPPSASSEVHINKPPLPGCSRSDLEAAGTSAGPDSPGAQTLAELKREVAREKVRSRPSKLHVPSRGSPGYLDPAKLCGKNISKAWTGRGPLSPGP